MAAQQPPADPHFIFDLPQSLIAQKPAKRRADARLLRVVRGQGVVGECAFRRLPDLLRSGDLLVVNDSRVLPARLRMRRAGTGGRVELLLIGPAGANEWLALARPSRRLRAGVRLLFEAVDTGTLDLEITSVREEGYVTVACGGRDFISVAEQYGEMPLPAYIRRTGQDQALQRLDRQRYQTVFSRSVGSVAAPTAGLHFEPGVLQALQGAGIGVAPLTLHVGPGTFRPPSRSQLANKRLHSEAFLYPADSDAAIRRARERGGRIIAVGTTSLRVLQTVRGLELERRTSDQAAWPVRSEEDSPVFTGRAQRRTAGWEVEGRTRLFLCPGDRIDAADGLLTNFHLPGSSLVMLVAAFAGDRIWRDAYAYAIEKEFRFYSYGDAMLILPLEPAIGVGPNRG